MTLTLPEGSEPPWSRRSTYYERIREAFSEIPGVDAAAATVLAVPPWIHFETEFTLLGQRVSPYQTALIGLISGDYFSALHIRLVKGRFFSAADWKQPREVAVVNVEFVRRFLRGEDPIGTTIDVPGLKLDKNVYLRTPPNLSTRLEIIGDVKTARNQGLENAPKPAAYVPYTLVLPPTCSYLVRTRGNPNSFAIALRRKLHEVAPGQPLTSAMTLDESITMSDRSYAESSTIIFSVLASIALILAAVGSYSVVSYIVIRRRREFGIRIALGARSRDIVILVLRRMLGLSLAGIGIGLLLSLAFSRLGAAFSRVWNGPDLLESVFVTGVVLTVVASILVSVAPGHSHWSKIGAKNRLNVTIAIPRRRAISSL